MVPLSALWLPILLSAVFVFVVSSVVHMALQVHKKDYVKLPNEAEVLAALRQHGVKPGQYMFPCAGSMKEMRTPEMLAKLEQGPIGTVIVRPSGSLNTGKSLLQWFVLSLVIGACTAYVAGIVLPAGGDRMLVFRVTSTVALMGYSLNSPVDSIWKGLSWGTTLKFMGDGLAYALATGATFAWLWPAGGAAL